MRKHGTKQRSKIEVTSHDFFISYTQKDRQWAEWVAWQLETAGYKVLIQAWDFVAGSNFVDRMDQATAAAARTLLILSDDYVASQYGRAEWAAAFRIDPLGRNQKLIPVRVTEVVPSGLLAQIVWTDIFDCDERTASQRLLTAVRRTRSKPNTKPVFPVERARKLSDKPRFPAVPRDSVACQSQPDRLIDVEPTQFADSIRAHTLRLQRGVDKLTHDQARVISQLRYLKRVRISGLPESGKTLVAAEKAIRMAQAGMRTAFLCHNPRLAEYVSELTKGSDVFVTGFTRWVSAIVASQNEESAEWTKYDEPTAETLARAFDRLSTSDSRYDAVIVDEGQDFREEWWALVEASLADPRSSLLYIFHDDKQALLPHRARYPFSEPVIDLSRNCRNGGRIYEIMRCLYKGAPECEPALKRLGRILFEVVRPGFEKEAVQRALAWFPAGELNRLVVLFSGSSSLAQSILDPLPAPLVGGSNWREEVRRMFARATMGRSVMSPAGGPRAVDVQLQALGFGPEPSAANIQLVRCVARQFTVDPETRRRVLASPQHRGGFEWRSTSSRLRLKHQKSDAAIRASEIVMHFERADWSVGIRQDGSEVDAPDLSRCPLYRVSDFKGLESSAVLLYVHDLGSMPNEEFLVAISRARSFLAIVIQNSTESDLPGSVRRALVDSQRVNKAPDNQSQVLRRRVPE